MTRITVLLFSMFLSTGFVFAGDYQIIYQEQIPGAENYVHIDPIINTETILTGFVYTDPLVRSIIIDMFNNGDDTSIAFSNSPVITINYSISDSLIIYSLDTYIRRIVLTPDTLSMDSLVVIYSLRDRVDQELRFNIISEMNHGILVEQTLYRNIRDATMGYGEEYRGHTSLISLDFSNSTSYYTYSNFRQGNIRGSIIPEFIYTDEDRGRYCTYGDPWNPGSCSSWDMLKIFAWDSSITRLGYNSYNYGIAKFLEIKDFIPNNSYEEMIFFGLAEDLNGLNQQDWHAACYSYETGRAEIIWYKQLSEDISLDYIYKPQHHIAGMRGKNNVITLNYKTGQLTDSVELDRDLENAIFFETGYNPSVLNLAGQSFDTIFVYQFQTPTDISEEPEIILPTTFQFNQNYPNPFNNGTIISFSNQKLQHLKLTITNILGQEIIRLHDTETPPGEFTYSWNGNNNEGNPVASGVYFARLFTQERSECIKLVLLK